MKPCSALFQKRNPTVLEVTTLAAAFAVGVVMVLGVGLSSGCKDDSTEKWRGGYLQECYDNGTCDEGLMCGCYGVCWPLGPGVEGQPCYENETCNDGLVCVEGTCREECGLAERQPCDCEDGTSGVQGCGPERTWAECECLAGCGDRVCAPAAVDGPGEGEGETEVNCPQDCAAVCGDGVCGGEGESHESCPEDCACGDGVCGGEGESHESCPEDCACGDGVCDEEEEGESLATCPVDCTCGSGVCDEEEGPSVCPSDCAVGSLGVHEFACVVLGAGKTRCWGANATGTLGDGTTTGSTAPVAVVGVSDAVQISVGFQHGCAVLGSGAVQCWGWNMSGELGNGGEPGVSTTPVTVVGVGDAVAVGAGAQHSCALHGDQRVSCWGDNSRGQLGDVRASGMSGQSTPVSVVSGIAGEVGALTDAVKLGVAARGGCVVRASGRVSCWGDNGRGQLGVGSSDGPQVCGDVACSAGAVEVVGLESVVAIASGDDHHCVLRSDGTVLCWGANDAGQLGPGAVVWPGGDTNLCVAGPCSPTPVMVTGLGTGLGTGTGTGTESGPAIAIAAGGRHSCAVLASGAVRCWGAGAAGQLGDGLSTDSVDPVAVSGIGGLLGGDLGGVLRVAAGGNATCAMRADSSLWCWGANQAGQLGDGTTEDRASPVRVQGL